MIEKTLSTNVLPIVNCGLYWTGLGDRIYDSFKDRMEDKGLSEKEFNKRYDRCLKIKEKAIATQAMKIINKVLMKAGLDMKVMCPVFCSPSEYNFEDDFIKFNLHYKKEFIDKEMEKITEDERFWKWLKERYVSYDGFICFMPSNKKEFFNNYNLPDLRWRCLCVMIMYELRSIDFDMCTKELQETV